MKNIPLHIEENELDQLLRQLVLDDEFTQNTLTMNADLIFSSAAEISPATAKETELIQKLEQAFIKRRGFSRFWLNGIIFLFIISAAVWIYKINSGNSCIAVQNKGTNGNTFSPVLPGDTADAFETAAMQENNAGVIGLLPGNDSAAIDSCPVMPAVKQEHFATPNTHMAIEPYWYEGKYIENEVPGPVFTSKATPETFKSATDTFHIVGHLPGRMYSSDESDMPVRYYTGEPFKNGSLDDMLYFNFGEYYSNAQQFGSSSANSWQMPWQAVEYANPADLIVKTDTINKRGITHLHLQKLPRSAVQIATQPFYFRKYEVTNKEYREFVTWVRASNGYANKPINATIIDTIEVTDPKDHNGEQIVLKGKNYRLVRTTTPTEDYNEVFKYGFFNPNSPAIKSGSKTWIYILPDTASWTTDFTFSYNEPMNNYYFWHPAYDNYPVVGVSWFQAMAFLDWKTHMHQLQLDKENVPYEIEYTLPSDIEWDLVLNTEKTGKNPLYNFWDDATCDWQTNLAISYPGHDDPFQQNNYLKTLLTKDEVFQGNFIRDGFFHTGPADLTTGKYRADEKTNGTHHFDPLGISWMDGNVSEWMLESYAENWKPFFEKHLLVLDAASSESASLAKQIEQLYDKGNAQNGKLVRGANWYDERFSNLPGTTKNGAGVSPKRFVDPAEQHCTVGFRYVIHVKRK
jgi:formylglycine-generating enzyme required for sulfatase activity